MNLSIPTPYAHAVLWHGRLMSADDQLFTSFINEVNIAPIDLSVNNGAELKAKDLLELKQFASLSPHLGAHKLIVIREADQLSSVVANSLLKLIEEPPKHLLIRLNAEHVSAVLPTIRSRCQLVYIQKTAAFDDRFPLQMIDTMTLSEQFVLAEKLAKDDALPAIITFWLTELEAQLLQGEPVDASIALGQTLLDRLRTNSNRRLALESWFLTRFEAAR